MFFTVVDDVAPSGSMCIFDCNCCIVFFYSHEKNFPKHNKLKRDVQNVMFHSKTERSSVYSDITRQKQQIRRETGNSSPKRCDGSHHNAETCGLFFFSMFPPGFNPLNLKMSHQTSSNHVDAVIICCV